MPGLAPSRKGIAQPGSVARRRGVMPPIVRVSGSPARRGPWVAAQWVIGGDLDQHDPDAVGIFDPHLGQSPRLGGRLAQNANTCCRQSLMFSLDIPHLEPDHHRLPGGARRVPGNFQQPGAEEEHYCGIGRRAELAINRQAQHIPVEMAAAAQVGGAQQDPAGQDFHTAILAPRGYLNRNAAGGGLGYPELRGVRLPP